MLELTEQTRFLHLSSRSQAAAACHRRQRCALVGIAGCGSSTSSSSSTRPQTAPVATSTTSPSQNAGTSSVSTGPVRATLRGKNHAPKVNADWQYSVRVTSASGQLLSGTVDIEFVFGGQVVGRDTPPTHTVANGSWHDTLKFPAPAVGMPLTFRAVVHTRLGSVTLDWPVTVRTSEPRARVASRRSPGSRAPRSGHRPGATGVLTSSSLMSSDRSDRSTRSASVSLTVAASEFVTITGPSGSGKSTLLNLIGSLDRPDDGTITVDGFPVPEPRRAVEFRRHMVGFVFQDNLLLPYLSARSNIEAALLAAGVDHRERRRRSSELLAEVGLGRPFAPSSVGAFRRPATSCRACACAREPPASAARRRADRCA